MATTIADPDGENLTALEYEVGIVEGFEYFVPNPVSESHGYTATYGEVLELTAR